MLAASSNDDHQYVIITDLPKDSHRAAKVKKQFEPPKISKKSEVWSGKHGKTKTENESYAPVSSSVDRMFPTVKGRKGEGKKTRKGHAKKGDRSMKPSVSSDHNAVSPSPRLSPSSKGKMVPSKAFYSTTSPTNLSKRAKGKGKDDKDLKKGRTGFTPTSSPLSMPVKTKGKGSKRKDSNNSNAKGRKGSKIPSNIPSLSPEMMHSKSPTRISEKTPYPTRYMTDFSVAPTRSQSLPPSYLPLPKYTPRPSLSSPRPMNELSASPSFVLLATLTPSPSLPWPSLKPASERSTPSLQIHSILPTYITKNDTTIPNSSVGADSRESSSSGSHVLLATATTILLFGLFALRKARSIRREVINIDDAPETM